MKRLGKEGTERTARHDDRTLGAKGSARPDGNCGRQRLEDRDLRIHATAADENRLHRLGYPVAADLLRAVARHETNDEPTDHGDEDRPNAQVIVGGRDERRRQVVVVCEIGNRANQPDERVRHDRADGADNQRGEGKEQEATIGGEVTQAASRVRHARGSAIGVSTRQIHVSEQSCSRHLYLPPRRAGPSYRSRIINLYAGPMQFEPRLWWLQTPPVTELSKSVVFSASSGMRCHAQ